MANATATWKKILSRLWEKPLPEGISMDLESVSFVVLDTETTGFDPEKDRILSLGLLKIQGTRIAVNQGVEVFLEQEHFDRQSVPIHGILKEGRHKRVPEAEAMALLDTYCKDAILVGHHLGFDLSMIYRARKRNALPELRNPALDTEKLYRKSLIKSPVLKMKEHYSLDELAKTYDLNCKDRHTALGDAYITAMAFLHILNRLQSRKKLSTRQLLQLGQISSF